MAKKINDDVVYPEVGTIEEKALKKFYKKLTDEQLDEWLGLEGLSYKACEHEAINRMRKCMAISAYHFPKVSTPKKASKYADLSTEDLVQMCMDNDVAIRDDRGDQRILRMYCIMALREAGVIA